MLFANGCVYINKIIHKLGKSDLIKAKRETLYSAPWNYNVTTQYLEQFRQLQVPKA